MVMNESCKSIAAVSAAECEELIKRMLTIDPLRRITISEIICHHWMTIAGSDAEFNKLMHESMRPLSPEPLEPLNELVLKHMDRLEIDRKQTLKVYRLPIGCTSTLPYLTLSLGQAGCYTCPALRPYQLGPVCIFRKLR